jgi:hypothetical protein
MDAQPGPDEHGNHPLTELFLQDVLVVDAFKPYAEQSYLEIRAGLAPNIWLEKPPSMATPTPLSGYPLRDAGHTGHAVPGRLGR